TELFAALRDSTPAELAAESPGSFARLGVDSTGGRWIRVAGGGRTLVELITGQNGPAFGTLYVRKPGDTRVFLWRGRPLPGRTRSGRDGRPGVGRRCVAPPGACSSPSRSIPRPPASGCTAPTGPPGPCTASSPGARTS